MTSLHKTSLVMRGLRAFVLILCLCNDALFLDGGFVVECCLINIKPL